MNAIITLLIYWSIAVGLIGCGLFALSRGFKLVLEGKGKSKEENSIEFLGVKVSVGSLGSLVMVTAFMWGWAAKLALPNYKDANIEIHALRQELTHTKTTLAMLEQETTAATDQTRLLIEKLSTTQLELASDRKKLKDTRAMLASREQTDASKKMTIVLSPEQKTLELMMRNHNLSQLVKRELESKLAMQQEKYSEFQAAIAAGDRSQIKEKSLEFERATNAVSQAIQASF